MGVHLLTTIRQSSSDIRLLWFSVFARMIAFGLTNQVLTLYLKSLGIPESKIGVFMSLTMIGDSVLSYLLTWNANSIGTRRVMRIGSFLMFACGSVFASGTKNFHLLLVAAVFGVISPSGGDTGPFKTIEESVLAKLTPLNHRPEVYAVHGTLAAIGSSCGNLLGGFFVQELVSNRGLSYCDAYRYSFYIFCTISLIKYVTMLFMSRKCEPSYIPRFERLDGLSSHQNTDCVSACSTAKASGRSTPAERTALSSSSSSSDIADQEETPLLHEETPLLHNPSSSQQVNTLTGLSPKSQSILIRLLIPFMTDSLGFGFMPSAWVVYYFNMRYAPTAAVLGMIFGTTDLIVSISAIPSAWMSKIWGPLRSTILTQIPCGLFFMAIPIIGKTLPVATTLYLLNQATTAFDVVPRQIILTSLIASNDLPKVLGTVNIAKQIARSISPCFTGILAEHGFLWTCFLISGFLLILANIILGTTFYGIDGVIAEKESTEHEIEQSHE